MTPLPGRTPASRRLLGAALLAACFVSALLAIGGAAPVAIDSPEGWADPREVLNVFSGMFLGYSAALVPCALMFAAAIGIVARGRKGNREAFDLPLLTGLLLGAVSVANASVFPDAGVIASLRDHFPELLTGLLAAIGAATLLAALLRSPLRTAAGALVGTAVLGGIGALLLIVWLRGQRPGGMILVIGCAGGALIGTVALAAAAAFVPKLSPGGRRSVHVALGASFALLLAVPLALARQTPGSRDTGLRPGLTAGTRATADAGAPNVLLISIDTLRADRLSCYGNPRRTSPAIDEVARGGVRFEQAFTTSSWTLPAHGSMLTGLYPDAHGADRSRRQSGNHLIDPLAPGVRTLAGILGENGWRTAGFVSNPMVSSVFGINRGFDEYHDRIDRLGRFLSFRDSLYWRAMMRLGLWHPSDFDGEVKVDEFFPDVLAWLDAHASERFFLFAHFMEPHYIYEPPENYRIGASGKPVPVYREIEPLISGRFLLTGPELDDLRLLYDGEIAWLDSRLRELFDRLDRLGLSDTTLVIITSDHGESIGEHGLFTHGSSLDEEQIRVPLIMRLPGRLPAGISVTDGMASHVDLLPTILDLTGQRPAEGVQGRSLRPLWEGGDTAPFQSVFAELRADIGWKKINPALGNGILMLRTRDSKLLLPEGGGPELFDLAADPTETRDISGSDPKLTRELSARLKAWKESGVTAREAAETQLDPTTLEQLRGLGYVAP